MPAHATVTDSRGRTSDPVSCTVPVTAYSTPSFTAYDAQRSNQAGTLADEGLYARCTASYSWYAIGSNSINTRVYYRETGSPQSWTLGNAELIPNGGFKVIGGSLAIDKTYDVWFQIWDYFTSGSPIPAYDTIQTAKCVMDWLAGGGGISFGQVASKPGVEISPDWPLRANGALIGVPSNENLLIGGNFLCSNPWQHGTNFTVNGTIIYTADRWRFGYGTVAKSVTGLYVNFSSPWATVETQIEHSERFSGKQMTLSVKLNGASGAIPCQCYIAANIGGVYSFPLIIYIPTGAAGTYSVTATIPTLTSSDTLIACFGCAATIGAFDIEWIKLEPGAIATPEYPRLPREELLLCQPYYQPVKDARIRVGSFISSQMDFTVPISVPMRVKPSLLGTWRVYSMAGAEQTGFTFVINNGDMNQGSLYLSAYKSAHGLTDAFLYVNAGALDAEI